WSARRSAAGRRAAAAGAGRSGASRRAIGRGTALPAPASAPGRPRRRRRPRPSARRRGPAAGQAVAVGTEELARGVDHHEVALLAEAGLVGFQAAVELRELRVAAEGFGVDPG